MQEKFEAVMKEHCEWLLSLRLVGRIEFGLMVAGILGSLAVMIVVTLATNCRAVHPYALLSACLGFFFIQGAIAFLGHRHQNSLLFVLVLIGEANLILAIFTGWPGLNLICYGIGVCGLVCLAFIPRGINRLRQRWIDIAGHTNRDDFKWFVTKAPLATRGVLATLARDFKKQQAK